MNVEGLTAGRGHTKFDTQPYTQENAPGWGSFKLKITKGEGRRVISYVIPVPVLQLDTKATDEADENNIKMISSYIQSQREAGIPVVAWRVGPEGRCCFFVNSLEFAVDSFTLHQQTKTGAPNPYVNYLGTGSNVDRSTITVPQSQFINFFSLDPVVQPKIGQTLTHKAVLTGQTPTTGLPLTTTLSFQPSRP